MNGSLIFNIKQTKYLKFGFNADYKILLFSLLTFFIISKLCNSFFIILDKFYINVIIKCEIIICIEFYIFVENVAI